MACEKEEDVRSNSNSPVLSGILYLEEGVPLAKATVSIDSIQEFTVKTDENGQFRINNVPKGVCKLHISKIFDDKAFSYRFIDIDVLTDISFDNQKMLNPVRITCELDSVSNILTVRWNKSQAEDFAEYELAGHSSSGSLYYSSTYINDTITTFQLKINSDYDIRIFERNNEGRMTGSNIMYVTTENNFLKYGDFEDVVGFNTNWHIISGQVDIVDLNQYRGKYCLLMQAAIDTANSNTVQSKISTYYVNLEKGEEYELSFWYKWNTGLASKWYPFHFYYFQDSNRFLNKTITPEGVPYGYSYILTEGIEWKQYKVSFYPSGISSCQFVFVDNIDNLYLDDIKIRKL